MPVCFAGCLLASLLLSSSHLAESKPPPRSYEIPYRLLQTKHVMVRVKVNGKGPFNLILDTGAPALFLSTAACKKARVVRGKDGWGVFKRFEIEGGLAIPNARGRVEDPFQLEGMNGLGLAGIELHGMLGYNILAKYRIELDLTKNKMRWTPLDFQPPPPMGLRGKHGEPTALNAMGAVMKMLGVLMGRKAAPTTAYRGFLGVELASAAHGIVIKNILKDSPAATAGLQVGDHITGFQGHAVASVADLQKWAAHVTAGKKVNLRVLRDGRSHEVWVRMKEGL